MILPCEVAVKSVVPAVKALMAKQLVEHHGMRQEQVADILGISQSAVSKYSNKVRGHIVEIDTVKEVPKLIDSMVILLINGGHQRREFLELFCQACAAVKRSGLLCNFCAKSDPQINAQDCGFCTQTMFGHARE